jgi:hypothetical protein
MGKLITNFGIQIMKSSGKEKERKKKIENKKGKKHTCNWANCASAAHCRPSSTSRLATQIVGADTWAQLPVSGVCELSLIDGPTHRSLPPRARP